MLRKGDIVKMKDADDPRSIPAYRTMRGEVIEVTHDLLRDEFIAIRVRWFDPDNNDLGTDARWRSPHTVERVS